jgi:hypothetical protein
MTTDDAARRWIRIIGWGFVVLGALSALHTLLEWMNHAPNTIIMNASFLLYALVGYGLLKQHIVARMGALLLAAVVAIGVPIAAVVMIADLASVDVTLFGRAVTPSPVGKGVLVVGATAVTAAVAGGMVYVLTRERVAQQFG